MPRHATSLELPRSARSALEEFPLDTFPAGSALFRQDTVPENAFVLRDGIVKLTHRLTDGRTTVVGLRRGGTLLAAESALARKPHPVGVVAVTPGRAYRIARRRLAQVVAGRGALSTWVHAANVAELEGQVLQAARLARLDARERLESYFEFVRASDARADGDVEEIDLPLRDWELAQLLAVTPSYLSRLIQELESHGRVIRRGRGNASLRANVAIAAS